MLSSGPGDGDVAAMDRVEGAAKHPYPLAITHGLGPILE